MERQPDCFGLVFPDAIGTYLLTNDGVASTESSSRGSGYKASYLVPAVHSRSMTACIYGLGQGILAATDQEIVKTEFVRSARRLLDSPQYSAARVTDNGLFTYKSGRQAWCAYFDLTSCEGNRLQASLLGLTTWAGKCFKLHAFMGHSAIANAELDRLLAEWIAYLDAQRLPNRADGGFRLSPDAPRSATRPAHAVDP